MNLSRPSVDKAICARSKRVLPSLATKTGRLILLGLIALAPLPALAALGVSMSVAPTYSNPISQGDITAFKISVTNSNNTAPLTGVNFTDTLPAEIKVAGAGLVSYICTNGAGSNVATNGAVSAVVGSGIISLTNGTVPQAGAQAGSCDIIVEVTSVTVGSFTNTIGTGEVAGNDGSVQSNGTPGAQSITVTGLNAPVITKSFSPATIVKDLPTTLTIVISNANNATKNLPLNGTGDTPAFAIQDNLPAGLAVAATPNASSICSGAGIAPTFNPATGNTTLTVLGGTVAAGGTCTLKVDVVANTTSGNYSNTLNNTINGTTQFGNTRGLTAGNATASLTVTAPLRVSKLFSPATVGAGQAANLTITLTNASPGVITLTTFTDDPIDGVGNAGYGLKINGTPTTTCPGSNVVATGTNTGITLTGGSITANSSCTITIPYIGTLQTPGTPQAFTNTISQGAVGTNDASIVSQPTTHSVTVVDQLIVAKSVVTGAVAPGNPISFSITVSNYSGNPLTNVRIADTLPGGMVILPTTPAAPVLSGTGCAGLTNDLSTPGAPKFTIGSVTAGVAPAATSCTVTFWAMLPANATVGNNLDNIIQGGGVCNNNGAGAVCNFNPSNSTSARVTVNSVVTVSKVFNPSSASEGTASQLTVTYTNLSAQPLTAANFTDNLPIGSTGQQLIIANPAVASSTCSGATITATPGSSLVSISGATIPARANNGTGANGVCVLKVNVIGAAGNYTNTLPAGALAATETYADGSTNTALTSPGPVSAGISYSSALTTTKSFSPSVIQNGGKSTVTLRLGNVGSGTLNNVSAIDPLPTGMTVANPSGASTTCGGSPVVTAVAGASSASITGATIPAGAQCDFIFDVKGTGGSNWVNTIPSGNITADGGVKNIAAVAATLTNNHSGALTITNNTSPNSLTAPGQVSVLSISITNNGSLALDNLNLTDYFTSNGLIGGTQTGMQVANTPGASTTCAGGIVSAVTAGTSVSLSSASLAAGASCTVSVNVTLNNGITVQNIIPANAANTAQGVSNSLPTTTSLSAGSNIGVTKQFIPDVVVPGTRARLRLTFINPQALPVTNLNTTDTLPAGVSVPASPSPNPTTTCSGATVSAPDSTHVRVSGGTLAAASNNVSTTCQAEIDVFVAAEGSYVNTIPANGVTGDIGGIPTSNPVPATATLLARSPATIAKTFSPNSVAPGVPSTLTITLTNPNNIALTAAALTDNFPANVAIAPTPNATTTCAGGVVSAQISATKVSVTGATIPANGSCNVKVDVISNISGVYTNTIPAEGLTTSENITNANPTSDVLTVSIPPTIGKQFSPVGIPPNGTSTLTIVLNNNNASAITLISNFDDVLPTSPGNIVIDSTPNVSKTCPGTVTANAGAAFVRYNNGGSIPAGGCTISVDVTGTTTGSYLNTIAAAALKTSVGNNPSPATATLLISTQGYISGRVFQDNNNIPNGTYESGTDSPLTNVLINLRDSTNAIIATTTTDALGNYAFTNLSAGTYSVEEPTQPPNTGNGITTAGTIVGTGTTGTATNLGTTPSRINTIVLGTNAGQVGGSINNNFAEVVGNRTLSGRVFVDYDNNGQINGTDQGIGAVIINLTGTDVNGNLVNRSTTTTANGTYSFPGLPAGTYTVTEPTQPTGTSNGITSAGTTGGTATTVATLPSNISAIPLLGANTVSANNNFAEIPGASPDLTISKTHSPSSFADGGSSGYYTIVPGNVGSVATTGTITIVDTLPAGMTVAAPATGSGWICTGSVGAAVVSCTSTASIAAGGTGHAITLRVRVAAGTNGQVLTNHAVVSGGGEPPGFNGNNTADDPTPIALGAVIEGHVWLDGDHDRKLQNSGDIPQNGWIVDLLLNDQLVATTITATDSVNGVGSYSFTGLAPGSGYEVLFRNPTTRTLYGSGVTNETNPAVNPGNAQITDGTINNITLAPGQTITQQSLPIDPSGVVYDAVTRNPVSGAVVTISYVGLGNFDPATQLLQGSASQTTGADGNYQFLLLPNAPGGTYILTITTYPSGYAATPSTIIPVCTTALSIGQAPPIFAAVQNSAFAPSIGTPAGQIPCLGLAGGQASTQYYFNFDFTSDPVAGSSNVINNHIPLDPISGGSVVVTKTTPLVNVAKSDLVPYTITVRNNVASTISVQDRIPPGFKYRTGSSNINGIAIEPMVAGRDLVWNNQTFTAGQVKTYKLMLIVGTGVGEGEYINQAWALTGLNGNLLSNIASATVRVTPDPTFDCSDIIGKVFDDQNANGYQDEGEPGIANVRVVTVRGLLVTTDPEGRFHVACADIPQADHGANFVMKLDERTLPSGYRLTTENPRDVRVTRGKMVKLNFGATVHRVVRLDLNGAAFAANQTELLPEWQQALEGMPDRLASRPSVLRIAYNPGSDDPALCKKRLEAVAKTMEKLWKDKQKGGGANVPLYPLVIETAVEAQQ